VLSFVFFCVRFYFSFYVFVLYSVYDFIINNNKNLCGRDGRTICGPQCVPKSTYVTLAHKQKPKFFYFGCSLVRRFYCKQKVHPITGRTDRQTSETDRQTDRQTDRVRRNMRPPPREEGRIIMMILSISKDGAEVI